MMDTNPGAWFDYKEALVDAVNTAKTTGSATRAQVLGLAGGGSSARTVHVQASISTAQGSNRDLKFTAVPLGTAGNGITVTYVDPEENDAALDVTVDGTDITVSLATDGAGAITSTGNLVMAAINANGEAAALVTATLAAGSTGVGVVAAAAAYTLADGTTTTSDQETYREVFESAWLGAQTSNIDENLVGRSAFEALAVAIFDDLTAGLTAAQIKTRGQNGYYGS